MKKIAAMFLCVLMLLESIPAFAADVGTNLALNAFVDVSAWDKNGTPIRMSGGKTRNMTDVSDYSSFQSQPGVEKAVLIMDLYDPQPYNTIYLAESYSAIKDFQIATSPDKKNWTTVYQGVGISPYGKNIHFNRVNHRYIRLEVMRTDNQFGDVKIAISSWRVYSDYTKTTEDLETAVYLAELKQKFLRESTLNGRFDGETMERYDAEIEKANRVLADDSATQEEIDRERDALEKMTAAFETDLVYSDEDYEYVRRRLYDNYTGNAQEKTEERLQTIQTTGETAKKWQETMIRNKKSSELWEDLIPAEANFAVESNKLATAIMRIRQMATAYCQEENVLYKDEALLKDIEYCIRFMLEKKYNRGIEQYSNWYAWVVSVPTYSGELMVLLRDELPQELLEEWRDAIEYYFPRDFHSSEEWTGANRLYLAAASMKLGFALHDAFYVHRAVYAVQQEGLYREVGTNDGDGYYWDGTYITHSEFMYNASYGRDWLYNTGNIISVLAGTPWQIEQASLDDIAKRLVDGFEAIIYKGSTVDAAAGRGVGSGNKFGSNVTTTIEQMCEYFSEPYRSKFLSMVKQFKIDQGLLDDPLVLNEEIEARGDLYRLKRFPIGDKVVGQFGDWGMALSMVSDRTKTFEASNGDAMKAWYASSGMLQILNDDRTQYDRNYWVAVDHYRLPGITVDLVPRTTTRFEGEMNNTNNWVASMDYEEKYGVAGMMTFNWNSSMSGKKSWFVFDNAVVALGSDIRGGTNEIQTVVDNRKLNAEGSNRVLINGAEFAADTDTVIDNVTTAHIQGNTEKSDVGYYFLSPVQLNAVKETRTAWEKDMWSAGEDAMITERFAKLWLNHGVHPQNAQYAYVILPNMSAEEVEKYQPDFEILSQDATAHAVKNTRLGVSGYNFWQKNGGRVGDVVTDGQLIMMTHEDETTFDISVTDPTFQANKPKTITFEQVNAKEILETSANVQVLETYPLKVSVDLKGLNGQKVTLRVLKDAEYQK